MTTTATQDEAGSTLEIILVFKEQFLQSNSIEKMVAASGSNKFFRVTPSSARKSLLDKCASVQSAFEKKQIIIKQSMTSCGF